MHPRFVAARLAVAALLSVAACGSSSGAGGVDAATDAGADDAPPAGDAAGRAVIEIYVAGDLTPKTFTDGASGETPLSYTMGLSRFDLLRSAADPAPVTVFDHGPDWVELNLLDTSLAGSVATASLPAGTYTHARVLLSMARCAVAATAHLGTASIPGTFTITGAFRDTTIDGTPLTHGQARYAFEALGQTQSSGGALPPLPSTPGGTVVTDASGTWLVFQLPQPLPIDPTSPATHRATITYEVYESFRWQDQATAGFADGVFDLTATAAEPVVSFGATGYRIEAE
ncbi:MAG TPA: hypothetical protein VGQ83_22055 [Polyangia bacterium]|jgi:hypothetical protein